MPTPILTTTSQIQCPHGGRAILLTTNAVTTATRANCLLATDIHTVVGCPFTIGPKYSPCVRIEWQSPATKVTVQGTAVLLQSSVGTCYSPENAPQGVAIIGGVQSKAGAL